MYPKTTEHVLGTRKNGHNRWPILLWSNLEVLKCTILTQLQKDVRIRCLDLIRFNTIWRVRPQRSGFNTLDADFGYIAMAKLYNES